MKLVNQMIRTKRLFEFITELVNIRNEEIDEKAQWEFWLHKDFERSFAEFRETIESNSQATAEVSEEELVEIVKHTHEIASTFVPPEFEV